MKGSYSKFTTILGAVWVGIAVTSAMNGNYWEATLSLLLALGVLVNGYLSWGARKLKREIEEKDGRIKAYEGEYMALKMQEKLLSLQLKTSRDRAEALRKGKTIRGNNRGK